MPARAIDLWETIDRLKSAVGPPTEAGALELLAALRVAGELGSMMALCTDVAVGPERRARCAVLLGRLEEARSLLVGADSAQACWARGDLAWAVGDDEAAGTQYALAWERGEQLTPAERACLALAWVPLESGDRTTCLARLETAQGDDPQLAERFWLDACVAWLRTPERGEAVLTQALADAVAVHAVEIEWQAHWALHGLARQRGASLRAQRHARGAVEALEMMAASLPSEAREDFWQLAPRSRLRRLLAKERPRASHTDAYDKLQWLAHNLKQLLEEPELDHVLSRIAEGAVQLFAAERCFVLLPDEAGGLSAYAGHAGEAGLEFSRSIAETVLIDGEPWLSVDARDDVRLQEFRSVHQLALRSVACVPIRSSERIEGVLYLEHRRAQARFGEQDLELLMAFADQAALALTSQRMIATLAAQRSELQAANQQLALSNQRLEDALEDRVQALRHATQMLPDESGSSPLADLVGVSAAMRQLKATLRRLCKSEVSVVIQGESGTGKELVARALHGLSPRAAAPFVSVNCGAIPESLLESELFGHVAGAFTGAQRARPGLLKAASGGTLFLDELADMPAKMQVDLLRVLQERRVRPVGGEAFVEIDVRVISASQVPLLDLVERDALRRDLYYRLSVVELALPPLRERPEDVPALCDHFLAAAAEQHGLKRLAPAALRALCRYAFPGNVRELEHLLLNAIVLCDGALIHEEDLRFGGQEITHAPRPSAQSFGDYKDVERQRILRALEECKWNRARAARLIGMPRRTFYRRLKEHGIELQKE